MSQASRHPRLFRLALEVAAESRNAGIRTAAQTGLILLNTLGRGPRGREWTRNFERCCRMAGIA